MVTTGYINLIHSKTKENPQLDAITSVMRRVSYAAVLILVISGLLMGGIFVYLQGTTTQLQTQRDTLMTQVRVDSVKEGLLLAIKQRIAITDKILASQKDVSKLFELVGTIVAGADLSSLAFDDNGKTTITVQIATLTDAVTMVDSLLDLASSGKIMHTSLVSFALTREQSFSMTLSFVPVF